ncbi:hypothetical protein [Nostoc sp.]|uniref:hypothetical protein n=1 Tax=Nostoc sp. TaxID=1180 RepID=UPI002FFBE5E0
MNFELECADSSFHVFELHLSSGHSNAVPLPHCLVPSLRLGMVVFEAPPLLLAAEPLGAAFPAGG